MTTPRRGRQKASNRRETENMHINSRSSRAARRDLRRWRSQRVHHVLVKNLRVRVLKEVLVASFVSFFFPPFLLLLLVVASMFLSCPRRRRGGIRALRNSSASS